MQEPGLELSCLSYVNERVIEKLPTKSITSSRTASEKDQAIQSLESHYECKYLLSQYTHCGSIHELVASWTSDSLISQSKMSLGAC